MDVEYFSSRHDNMLIYSKQASDLTFHHLLGEDGEVAEHYDKVNSNGGTCRIPQASRIHCGVRQKKDADTA